MSPHELAVEVENTINYYKDCAERLQALNIQLREHAKEYIDNKLKAENAALRTRLALSYGEFASEKEKNAYLEFEKRHMHDRATSRANGGRAPYLIPTGTGFGTLLTVKCPICGKEQDITDTEAW